MKILVVGGGGREHAICWKLSQEKNVEKVYCAPGNAGIASVADCLDIKDTELDRLADFAEENKIDLTVVGPEVPLVMGISDVFAKRGLRVFGPDASCSRLEGSKLFSKEFFVRHALRYAPTVQMLPLRFPASASSKLFTLTVCVMSAVTVPSFAHTLRAVHTRISSLHSGVAKTLTIPKTKVSYPRQTASWFVLMAAQPSITLMMKPAAFRRIFAG